MASSEEKNEVDVNVINKTDQRSSEDHIQGNFFVLIYTKYTNKEAAPGHTPADVGKIEIQHAYICHK